MFLIFRRQFTPHCLTAILGASCELRHLQGSTWIYDRPYCSLVTPEGPPYRVIWPCLREISALLQSWQRPRYKMSACSDLSPFLRTQIEGSNKSCFKGKKQKRFKTPWKLASRFGGQHHGEMKIPKQARTITSGGSKERSTWNRTCPLLPTSYLSRLGCVLFQGACAHHRRHSC